MTLLKSLLTREEMISLIETRKETATQDYRRELPPRGYKTCASLDLLKDIVALANIGGGVIVFGVENENFTAVGLDRARSGKRLDDTDIGRAIAHYLEAEVEFELTFLEHKNKEFAFLAVRGATRPLIFRKTAVCDVCGPRASTKHFFAGATFIRLGSSTVRASEAWLTERLRDLNLLEAAAPGSGLLMNNLPGRDSIYDTFVGRNQAFEEVAILLRDQRRRVTWIQGSGGIGKTALAYRVAESVVAESDFLPDIDYVVWISAKENALTLDGIQARVPTLTRLSDVVRAIGEATHLVDLTAEAVHKLQTADEAVEALRPLLKDHTGLLVLDNLETVQDKEVLFLLQGLPGQTRALATTRRSMDAIGRDTVILEPLSFTEAEELIESEAIRTGRSWLTGDQQVVETVMQLSGRIPLAIRLIVPRLESPKALRNYTVAAPRHQNDLLEFCYEQTFRELELTDRLIFFALSLFEEGASLADLGFVLEVDLNDHAAHEQLLQQIEKLWHLSLAVIKNVGVNARYDMQSLVRRFGARRLATDPKLKQTLKLRLTLLEVRKTDDLVLSARKALEDYLLTGRYEDSVTVLDECVKRDSKCVEAWLAKAELEVAHAKQLPAATAAAVNVRQLARRGTVEWQRATSILADLALKGGEARSALDLLLEVDRAHASLAINLLLAKCYEQISTSQQDQPESALANQKEAAECARLAALQARRASNREAEGQACAIWARSAVEFNPGVAYQAAARALQLRASSADLKVLQQRALAELPEVPRGDLLGLEA